ncbi:ATP-binding protein [Crossiella sp. NPDC003009]
MRYGVLGPLVVWGHDGDELPVPEAKVRALLANLLLHNGGPVPVDRLLEDLWDGCPPGRPVNALQAKVSRLRQVLGRDEVLHQPAGYRLRLAADQLDAARFQELLCRAHTTAEPQARAELLAEALDLWRGAPYAELADAPFARAEIARLAELRLTALEDLALARLDLGEQPEGLAELVARYPLRERPRLALMRALYRAGRQTEALDCFQDLRRRLDEELGVTPGPEIMALHQAILRQEPALAAPRQGRTNLPAPVTELVGRRQAIAELRVLLAEGSGHRAVSLVGPGGVGKTRLAAVAAHGLIEHCPDGVWLVELAGLSPGATTEEVAERIIATLGLCETTTAEPAPVGNARWLGQALAGRKPLLLLDNCEHLVEPVAALVADLLAAAAGVRVLVTSHEPLDIPGELVRPVPPLAVPDAVELFSLLAAAAGCPLDPAAEPAVAIICRRLDGIPLALELLAPRLRVLSPDQLAERLDDRFALPVGNGRGRPARQQTLRAMIDWSWELLTEPERTVLSELAVHPDGCVLPAAVRMCAGAGIPVLEVLSRLVDRSLVVRDGERFRLLESVAAYCLDRLTECGELAGARARFTRCYLDLAEHVEPRLRGPEQRHCLDILDAETVNLRRALEIAGPLTLRLASSLAWYWFLRGRFSEARRSLRAALAAPGGTAAERAVATAWLSGFELRAAPTGFPSGIEDPALVARLRWFLGDRDPELTRDDPWAAAAVLLEADPKAAEARFRELGDGWGLLRAHRALAEGDPARAKAALAIAEDLGLWTETVDVLCLLGDLAPTAEEAQRCYRRALRVSVDRAYPRGQAMAESRLSP